MELWCFLSLGFYCLHAPEERFEPPAIMFSDDDFLRIDVRLEYLPYEYDHYVTNIIKPSENISVILKSPYINENNTMIHINEPLLRKYTNAVVKIVFKSSYGKGDLIRDVARLIYSKNSEVSGSCTKSRCAIDLAWLKSYPPADDESTYRHTVATIKKQQHVVSFKDQDALTVALGFKHIPSRIHYVHLIFGFGREDDSQFFLTRFNSEQPLVLTNTFDQAYLKVRLCMNKTCGVSEMLPIIFLQYDDSRTDQKCLGTRCNIILDFEDESHESVAGAYGMLTWLSVVAVGVAALVFTLGVVMVLRRRSKRDQNDGDEDVYATAQVSYAVLEFSSNSDRGLSTKEESPYAVITGVLEPGKSGVKVNDLQHKFEGF